MFDNGYERERSWYDTAQVCLNGHMINTSTRTSPERSQSFCSHCGASTITQCGSCGAHIRGFYHIPGVAYAGGPTVPDTYCYNCGKAYPWTEIKLKAAKEYAEELESLSDDDKELLKRSLDGLVRESPNTEIAALRFKQMMTKAGPPAAQGLSRILTDVLSAAAKGALGLG